MLDGYEWMDGLTGLDWVEMIENPFFPKNFSLTIATKSSEYSKPTTLEILVSYFYSCGTNSDSPI